MGGCLRRPIGEGLRRARGRRAPGTRSRRTRRETDALRGVPDPRASDSGRDDPAADWQAPIVTNLLSCGGWSPGRRTLGPAGMALVVMLVVAAAGGCSS